MNYRGSYRRLLGNAKAAMMAAIEVYNKPTLPYRDECAVILVLNAWELLLKAMISKAGQSVFYRKKRGQPYRTLSWQHAFQRASGSFPEEIRPLGVQRNLEMLNTYRDNSVHFYNEPGFGAVVHALAQTSIKNFRDLLEARFGQRLEDEIAWTILPLGVQPPVDVVAYMSQRGTGPGMTSAVRHFLTELAASAAELKGAGEDTARLMTIFDVKLESVKKIGDADIVVGVTGDDSSGPLVVTRTQDPNETHPLRQKDLVEAISILYERPFTAYVFQAIAWKHDLKGKQQYCWQATEGVLIRYSRDTIDFIKRLPASDVAGAIEDYRSMQKKTRKTRRPTAA